MCIRDCGFPIEKSRVKFTESIEVLILLLTEENTSWKGKYYNFEPITIMPRPISTPLPMMIAAMDLDSIRNSASKGYNVQSTVLSGTKELLLQRVNAFKEGCSILGEKGKLLKLSMQRIAFAANDYQDAREQNKLAYEYYKRFDNMFTGPGKVNKGFVDALPRSQTLEELTKNLIDQLKPFNIKFHLNERVEEVKSNKGNWQVKTNKGTEFSTPNIIIAGGVGSFAPRKYAWRTKKLSSL